MKSRFCVDQAFERLVMDVKGFVILQCVRVIPREAIPSAVANPNILKKLLFWIQNKNLLIII
ncbi:MAG: hypothetical protein CMK42_03060 [Porticoccaceae bacterium]|nr:hypothetical protein [Porticoccaceae bacterium]